MPRTPVTPPSARDRIGGPWAASPHLVVLVCALTVLVGVMPAVGVNAGPFARASVDITSVAVQCLAIVAVFAVARVTVLRRVADRPAPIRLILVGLVAASARLAVSISFEGIPNDYSTAEAIVAGVSVIGSPVLAVALIVYLLATQAWYVETRTRLIQLDVELEARRLRAVGALGALEEITLASAQLSVDGAMAAVRKALEGATERPEQVAHALLSAARDGVRPAARQLADGVTDDRGYPRISIVRAMATKWHRHPLPILLPALILVVIILPRAAAVTDVAGVALSTFLLVASIVVAFPLGRYAIERRPRLAIPVTVLACAAAIVPTLLLMTTAVLPARSPVASVVAIFVVLFIVVVVVALVKTVEDTGAEVLETLRQPLAEIELQRLAADRAREHLKHEIGMHLHSSVQPQLVAASYAIQDAVARGDRTALEDAIAFARAALDQRLAPMSPQAPTDLVATVAEQWAGILEVSWDPTEIPAAAQTRAVADVIRECLSNAIVHGNATHATIHVSTVDGAVDVRIADDGRGPQPGEPGLGSAVLNEATAGNWGLHAGAAGGVVVEARVPVQPLPAAS